MAGYETAIDQEIKQSERRLLGTAAWLPAWMSGCQDTVGKLRRGKEEVTEQWMVREPILAEAVKEASDI